MTYREPLASGGVTELEPASAPSSEARSLVSPSLDHPYPNSWEEWFAAATHAQRAEALAEARRLGFVQFHRLPQPGANGACPSGEPRPFLGDLLQGTLESLPPLAPAQLSWIDDALDDDQRDAVARALATPDLFLLDGVPGAGKSRTVAEIVAQAARRGERVLVLGASSTSLDPIFQRLGRLDDLWLLRCLAPREDPATLPPDLRRLTFAERLRQLRDMPLAGARADVDQTAEQCRALRRLASLFDQLDAQVELREHHERRRTELETQLRELPDRIQNATADDQAEFTELASQLRSITDSLHRDLDDLNHQVAVEHNRLVRLREIAPALERHRDAARQQLELRRSGRWWSLAWWRCLFQSGLDDAFQQAESALTANHAETAQVETALNLLVKRTDQRKADADRAVQAVRQAQMTQRLDELQRRLDAVQAELAAITRRWSDLTQELTDPTLRPAACDRMATQSARQLWRERMADAERREQFARDWFGWLEKTAPSVEEHLVQQVHVVAATYETLVADPLFGGSGPAKLRFDLVLLQDVESLRREAVYEWTGLAPRAILVRNRPGRPASAATDDLRRNGAATDAIHVFDALWRRLSLGWDHLTASWCRERGRLVCRLFNPTADEERCLQYEQLVDRPDIELGIVASADADARLAVLRFPDGASIAEAKQYVWHEMQELPVAPAGRCFRWRDDEHRVDLEFVEDLPHAIVDADLGDGITERVARQPGTEEIWQTVGFRFDRAVGWDGHRARCWIARHVGLCESQRTARLVVPHRMTHELAMVLDDLLEIGYRPGTPASPSHPASHPRCSVEFIACIAPPPAAVDKEDRPARRERSRGGKRGAVAVAARPVAVKPLLSTKGGAGLELNAADARHRERLSNDLRSGLPELGFVNLVEAQILAQFLESLVAPPGCAPANRSTPASRTCRREIPSIAVVSVFPAQVEILRRLVARSPVLASCDSLLVDSPEHLAHREFDIVCVSLTRSHPHRAVAFADSLDQFVLVFTRSRSRLLLFGDPGAVFRRTQWEGAVDGLDLNASRREREFFLRLIAYLQGQGRHQQWFRFGEGVGP